MAWSFAVTSVLRPAILGGPASSTFGCLSERIRTIPLSLASETLFSFKVLVSSPN